MLVSIVQNGLDALSLGSLYALTALGIGLIFSVMRLVNFAQGSYIACCAFALLEPAGEGVSRLFVGLLPAWLLVIVVVLVGMGLAVASEILLFRHLRGAQPATMMIASFVLSNTLQNILLTQFGSRPISVDLWPSLTEPIVFGGVRVAALQLITFGVTALSLSSLTVFLYFTRFGSAMRASAENFRMAQMLGVPANRIILTAFALSGGLAALASLMTLPQTGVANIRMGEGILLAAFVATVVGGLGSLSGAVLSGYLLGFVSVGLQVLLPEPARPFRSAFLYIAIIVVLLLRPQGLFSFSRKAERI